MDEHDYSAMQLMLTDTNSPENNPIESIQVGDSLSLGFSGLSPCAPLQVYLHDDEGKEWSYARIFADNEGHVAPFVFWYHSGVIGRPPSDVKIGAHPDPAFETFEQAAEYFAVHKLTLSIRDIKGKLVAKQPI